MTSIEQAMQSGRCLCGHSRTAHDFIWVTGGERNITLEPCRANDVCVCRDWVLDQNQPGDEPNRYLTLDHDLDQLDPREHAEEDREYHRITGGA